MNVVFEKSTTTSFAPQLTRRRNRRISARTRVSLTRGRGHGLLNRSLFQLLDLLAHERCGRVVRSQLEELLERRQRDVVLARVERGLAELDLHARVGRQRGLEP